MKDPFTVIKHPISTEKAVKLMESENKLTLIVAKRANKAEIREAVAKAFNVKPVKVNTVITPQGQKKAYVKLAPENPALDIATQLGMI